MPALTLSPRFRAALAMLLLIAATVRFLISTQSAIEESLQMDFAVYFAAGRAVSDDLNPYINQAPLDLRYWDGGTRTVHSRFLYPPAVSQAFIPFGMLPYPMAKQAWTLLSVALLVALLLIASRAFELRGPGTWVATALGLTFFPVTACLDRGQIDILVALALCIGAISLSKCPRLTGGAAALAGLIKPPHALIGIALLRAPWSRTRELLLGGSVMVLLSILACPSASFKYATEVLPRVSQHDQKGDGASFLPRDFQQRLWQLSPPGFGWMDDRVYRNSSLSFEPSATLVRPLLRIPGLKDLSPPLVSLTLFLVLFALRHRLLHLALANSSSFLPAIALAWMSVAVLLTSPLTWTMNLVWLLPLIPGAIAARVQGRPRWLLEAGLIICGLPWFTQIWETAPPLWWPGRFTLGLLLVFFAIDRELRICTGAPAP